MPNFKRNDYNVILNQICCQTISVICKIFQKVLKIKEVKITNDKLLVWCLYKSFFFLLIPYSGDGSVVFLGILEFLGCVDASRYGWKDLEKTKLPNDFLWAKSMEVHQYISFCKFPVVSTYTGLHYNTFLKSWPRFVHSLKRLMFVHRLKWIV